jgi:hypothetical protein
VSHWSAGLYTVLMCSPIPSYGAQPLGGYRARIGAHCFEREAAFRGCYGHSRLRKLVFAAVVTVAEQLPAAAGRRSPDGRASPCDTESVMAVRLERLQGARHHLVQRRLIPTRRSSVTLPAQSFLMLTLCLHELATDAAKYRSLSNGSGQVHVVVKSVEGS